MAKHFEWLISTHSVSSKRLLLVLSTLLLSFLISSSCHSGEKTSLGIYLADTGELVLSDREIQTYHPSDSTLELTEGGIEKWNSFLTYQTIPKLQDSLFSREFVLRIEGREICRGKFWSNASSSSYSGVVILDALFKLDVDHNTLSIKSGYAVSDESLDTTINSELIRFFERRGPI